LKLVEECQKAWKENKYTIADLMLFAGESQPFTAFIDTDHTSFINAGDLPAAITGYCQSTGQDAPETHGEIIRTILEGLAFKFRTLIRQTEDLRGAKPESIYITGDGAQNELLFQLTANCCGIPVITSSDEAVVAGNILVQAQALGIVKNVDEIRDITSRSFPTKTVEPSEEEVWNEAYDRYLQII